ncbi:deoxyribonuclease-2-beta isoform X2 [Conger conger]|uniref:deoxyribonuclease-2-beta isoform X2 n=1 Tax=Conger conger TaxID=82655 RepID=UPI002A59D6B6|nr:deoxyribonuclease-2-beta isoform X2 [Conger conger]XP_061095605.1 deoxyribonuclease-2-beta isoform X2 [Conger conger]
MTLTVKFLSHRFIMYKLPKYKIDDVGNGLEYMYLDSSEEDWQLSKFLVNTSQGALGSTLKPLYTGRSNSSAYVLYNDAPPLLNYSMEHGHTKGALHFDQSQGFWLIHSIPHFPPFPERGYSWPPSGKKYGQTVFCVTYKYVQFHEIAQQLLYYNPNVYNCSLPAVFQKEMSSLALLCNRSKLPWVSRRLRSLISAKGEHFLSFAKSKFYIDDIYTGWVAQTLKTDLLAETWQHSDHPLPSNCSLPYHVMNIRMIQLKRSIQFKSSSDHSKWCVSRIRNDHWTCLGDLNRAYAQIWRSGGLVCSQNPIIYQAFRQAVAWYMSC